MGEIYQVYDLDFCTMDFPQTQTSGLKIIYVSDKEVRLRTKNAYQII